MSKRKHAFADPPTKVLRSDPNRPPDEVERYPSGTRAVPPRSKGGWIRQARNTEKMGFPLRCFTEKMEL